MFINFGQIVPLNNSENFTIDLYNQIEDYLKVYIDKASKLDCYGITDKADVIWEEGNKIVYLIQHLYIARERVLKDYQNCALKPVSFYRDAYKLDCIAKTFSCFTVPFDVDPLYDIFGLGKNFRFDGIGYDAVAIDGDVVCNVEAVLTIGY